MYLNLFHKRMLVPPKYVMLVTTGGGRVVNEGEV